MACLGTDVDKKRECLTINDEELSAEIVSLQDDSSPRSHDDAFHVEFADSARCLDPPRGRNRGNRWGEADSRRELPGDGRREIQGTRWRGDRAGRRLHLRLRLACLQPRRKTQAFDVSAHSLQDGKRRHDQERRPADDRTDLATGGCAASDSTYLRLGQGRPGRGRGTGPETAEHRRHRRGRRAPLCRASDAECRRRHPYCQRAGRRAFRGGRQTSACGGRNGQQRAGDSRPFRQPAIRASATWPRCRTPAACLCSRGRPSSRRTLATICIG